MTMTTDQIRALYDALAKKVTAGAWQNETYNQGLWDMMQAVLALTNAAPHGGGSQSADESTELGRMSVQTHPSEPTISTARAVAAPASVVSEIEDRGPGTLYARIEAVHRIAEQFCGHSPTSSEPPELAIERALSARTETPANAQAIKDAAADISSMMPSGMIHGTGTYERWVEGAITRAFERHGKTPSAIGRSEPDEDGERYRWFRNECDQARRIEICEYVDKGYLLDHHIDKGRSGL